MTDLSPGANRVLTGNCRGTYVNNANLVSSTLLVAATFGTKTQIERMVVSIRAALCV